MILLWLEQEKREKRAKMSMRDREISFISLIDILLFVVGDMLNWCPMNISCTWSTTP